MATKMTEEGEVRSADYLEKALEDLDRARHDAAEEVRSMIDAAISRSREALDQLRTDTEDRVERLRARAEERTAEWQRTLEEGPEDVRRELGIRTVRAQRSQSALKAMSEEIKHQKKELTVSH